MTVAQADAAKTREKDRNVTPEPQPSGRSNLLLRVISSLVLAPVAVAAAYFGGTVFLVFWAVAALGVLWEWDTLVCAHDKNPVLTIGSVAIVGAALLLSIAREGTAISLIALAALGIASLASRVRRSWCALGVFYAGAILIAPVLIRHDVSMGFTAMLFLFVIVWLTDSVAYFTGRAIGGPKLMPRVSPKKTWSGAVGGTLAGVLGGVAVAQMSGLGNLTAVGALALVLSIVAQSGDLFESGIKRRFDAKDSSGLLPGHGGLMDRLDGFVTAAIVAALIGFFRGGLDTPAHGLLVW